MNTTPPTPADVSPGPVSSSLRPAGASDRKLLADVLASLTGTTPNAVRVGKFELGDVLGEGARGIVYTSRDPDLDRPVALKILRRRLADPHDPKAWRDAFREAKALERVTHRNVAHVYEVGVDDEQAWLAMELVRGPTLREWQNEAGRTWRDILRIYVRVGRGLAEAHRRRVTHGDLKPDNVLVGPDGVPKVVDFGLAAVDDDDGLPGGTPEYMAPEQLEVGGRSPASDQFSFCVALFEALTRVHPYSRWTMDRIASTLVSRQGSTTPLAIRRAYCRDLLANVERGEIQWPRLPLDFPSGVRTAIEQGLARDPARRFGSMDALLDRLDLEEIGAKQRKWGWAFAGAVATLAVGTLLGYQLQGSAGGSVLTLDECRGRGSRFDEVWNDGRRALLEQRVPAAAGQVAAALERYRIEWQGVHEQMCERAVAKAVPPDWEPTCLEGRRLLVDGYFRALDGNRAPLTTIGTLLNESPIFCLLDETDHVEPASEEARIMARIVRELLRQAFVDEGALRYDEGLRKAERALADAEVLGFDPLIAEALYQRGRLRAQRALYVDRTPEELLHAPMSDLHDAIVLAAMSDHHSLVVDASIFRARALAVADFGPPPLSLSDLGLDEGEPELVMAAQRAEILEQHGLVAYHRALGSPSEAPQLLAQALEAYGEALELRDLDEDALGRAKLLENTAHARLAQHAPQQAELLLAEAIRFWRQYEPTRGNLPHLYAEHVNIVMTFDPARASKLAGGYLAELAGDDEGELVVLAPSILCHWGEDKAVELADRAMALLDAGVRVDPLHELQLRVVALGALVDGEQGRRRNQRIGDATRWAEGLQRALLAPRAPDLPADKLVMAWGYIGRTQLFAGHSWLAAETLAPWMSRLHQVDSRIASQLALDLTEAYLELDNYLPAQRALDSAARWVMRSRQGDVDASTLGELEARLAALAREATH